MFGFSIENPKIILHFSCTDYALTMHQAIHGMVEANRKGKINKKNEPKSYDLARFLCISYEMLV